MAEYLDPGLVKQILWENATEETGVYAFLDGAWSPNIYSFLVDSDCAWCSLYQGSALLSRLPKTPWIVRLNKASSFTKWLLDEGWGQGWSLFFRAEDSEVRDTMGTVNGERLSKLRDDGQFAASTGLEDDESHPLLLLRRHFRQFTRVEFEDSGGFVLFRFFDPGVLPVYLDSCNEQELTTFFGPVRSFIIEVFSEASSLNRPDALYIFRRHPEQERAKQTQDRDRRPGPLPSFTAAWFEKGMTREKPLPLDFTRHHVVEREGNALLMIRAPQRAMLAAERQLIFQEKVSQTLAGMGLAVDKAPGFRNLRTFAARQIDAGRVHGLKTQAELMGYAQCALVLGEDLTPTRATPLPEQAQKLLQEHAKTPIWNIGARLSELAEAGLQRMRKEEPERRKDEPLWEPRLSRDTSRYQDAWAAYSPVALTVENHLRRHEFREMEKLGQPKLDQYVAKAVELCHRNGIYNQDCIAHYAYMGIFLGLYFYNDQQHEKITTPLRDREKSNQDRVRQAYEIFRTDHDLIAGPKRSYYKAATERMSVYPLTEDLVRKAQTDPQTLPNVLTELWPEKALSPDFNYENLFMQARTTAISHALTMETDFILFAVVSFFLGTGFMDDPYRHWAARIVNDHRTYSPDKRLTGVLQTVQKFIGADMKRKAAAENGRETA